MTRTCGTGGDKLTHLQYMSSKNGKLSISVIALGRHQAITYANADFTTRNEFQLRIQQFSFLQAH